ncbi:50S ribosomal protein L32, partial [bacterium]|nr:50S ribosomal protein L32 [bacterium]
MAVQQRRVSKARKNKRRSHHHLDQVMVSRCNHCDK